MTFPNDQINTQEAFAKLIREGLSFTADGLLGVKNKTWIYKALKDKLNVKTGSNPGTNTLLDGNTTMYRVIDEKSFASFREIKVNENTANAFDGEDKRFQLEVPIKQGITNSQRTTFSQFIYDEQTGGQLSVTKDLVFERANSFKEKLDEVISKWIDITLVDLLFNSSYKAKIENNTSTAGDSTIQLSYSQLTSEISNVSNYKFVYDIERALVLSETINMGSKELLGIILIHEAVLSKFKEQFKDDAGFNSMSARERDNYVTEYAVNDYFTFPNSRITFVTMPLHLEASLLDDKTNPTEFTLRFISKEAINQINWLNNPLDDISNFENKMISFGGASSWQLETIFEKATKEMNQTYGFRIHTAGEKLISGFSWYAGIRMCLQPEQPKRSCCSFTLDNDTIFGSPANTTVAITKAINNQSALLARFKNS